MGVEVRDSAGGEKWSCAGGILQVEPKRCVDRLDVGYKGEREESRMISRFV